MSGVLAFPELQTVTGYQRSADVERCLKERGIAYFRARVGVWTTLDLINAAGGISAQTKPEAYSPEII